MLMMRGSSVGMGGEEVGLYRLLLPGRLLHEYLVHSREQICLVSPSSVWTWGFLGRAPLSRMTACLVSVMQKASLFLVCSQGNPGHHPSIPFSGQGNAVKQSRRGNSRPGTPRLGPRPVVENCSQPSGQGIVPPPACDALHKQITLGTSHDSWTGKLVHNDICFLPGKARLSKRSNPGLLGKHIPAPPVSRVSSLAPMGTFQPMLVRVGRPQFR
jgi:hypothetical protein